MTGKLADKIPLTMSSLINTIPDSLYPEEDIPTSMNIFTSTESINHYSQMNTGKIFFLSTLQFTRSVESGSKCDETGTATVVFGLGAPVCALTLLRTNADFSSREVRCVNQLVYLLKCGYKKCCQWDCVSDFSFIIIVI